MTARASKSAGGVQSVERAFELLEIIARNGGDAALSELAASTQLPMPTIHRLLRTLVALGYARQLPNRRYCLGPRLIPLGEAANHQLGALSGPVLRQLAETLGESANVAVLDGTMATYVAQMQSAHSMRMITEIGRRAMLHQSGVGKAMLSVLDDDRVRQLASQAGLPASTAKTITTLDRLLADVRATRERGYAIDEEEQELGVRCIAVSVPGAPTPMALSVSGPVTRVDQDFIARAVPQLHAAAEQLGSQLISAAE